MPSSRNVFSYVSEAEAADGASEAASPEKQGSGQDPVPSREMPSPGVRGDKPISAAPISIDRARGVASEIQRARYLAGHPLILGVVPIAAPPAATLYADAEDALTTGASGFYVRADKYGDGLSSSLLFAEGTFRSRFPGYATVYHGFSPLPDDAEKDAMFNWLTSFRIGFAQGRPADFRARVIKKALVDYGGRAADRALVLFLDNAENMLHWDVRLIASIHEQLKPFGIALLTFSGVHTAGLERLEARFGAEEAAGVRLGTVLRMPTELQTIGTVDHFAELFRQIDSALTLDGRSWTSAFLPLAVKAHFKLENEASRAFDLLSGTNYTTRDLFECVRRFLKLAAGRDVEAFAPPGIDDELWLEAARFTPLGDLLPGPADVDLSAGRAA